MFVQPYHGDDLLHFHEIMMMSVLYQTKMLSWICIVIALWGKNRVHALTTKCCMLSGEAANTNFIVFDLIHDLPGVGQ